MVTTEEAKDYALEALPRDRNREELHIVQNWGTEWGVHIENYKYNWVDGYNGKAEEVGVEFMFKAPRKGIKALIDRCCEMLYNELQCHRANVRVTSALNGDRVIVYASGFVSNMFQTSGTTTRIMYQW